jgi:hypothetical protein
LTVVFSFACAAGVLFYDHMERLSCLLAFAWTVWAASDLPVRGLHLMAPRTDEVPAAIRFISEELPKHRVNVLVLEIDYHYRSRAVPRSRNPMRFRVKTSRRSRRRAGGPACG